MAAQFIIYHYVICCFKFQVVGLKVKWAGGIGRGRGREREKEGDGTLCYVTWKEGDILLLAFLTRMLPIYLYYLHRRKTRYSPLNF